MSSIHAFLLLSYLVSICHLPHELSYWFIPLPHPHICYLSSVLRRVISPVFLPTTHFSVQRSLSVLLHIPTQSSRSHLLFICLYPLPLTCRLPPLGAVSYKVITLNICHLYVFTSQFRCHVTTAYCLWLFGNTMIICIYCKIHVNSSLKKQVSVCIVVSALKVRSNVSVEYLHKDKFHVI